MNRQNDIITLLYEEGKKAITKIEGKVSALINV